jgi:phytanoyl-CoA hydroxylase
MQLLPGEHREPILHWKRRDWQICDSVVQGKRSTAVLLKPGGLLLFDGLLPHGTPHNRSGQRRRALQFHYAGANVQRIAATERMRIFGSEGKDATC